MKIKNKKIDTDRCTCSICKANANEWLQKKIKEIEKKISATY